MSTVWLDALEAKKIGGWKRETQFVRSVGQGYLIASDLPGTPVEDAQFEFSVETGGKYRVFVRTKNWKLPEAPGRFHISVNNSTLPNECGKQPITHWYWDIAGDIELKEGKHTLSVKDSTGWLSRFAAIIITDDMNFTPSPEKEMLLNQRNKIRGITPAPIIREEFDLVVVGAGPGGFATAISAARNGVKTALISGRPCVGGNASDEGTVSIDGASARHVGMHETGIINEIKVMREHYNFTNQKAIEALIEKEENLTVFTDELCIDCTTEDDKIISVKTVHTHTLEYFYYTAPLFADCTGDGWLGYYAGAAYRFGREAKWELGEEHAPEVPDRYTMSGCVCDCQPNMPDMLSFRAVDVGHPVSFETPDWAVKFTEPDIAGKRPARYTDSEWWLENSQDFDDMWDDEYVRDELVRISVGYFGWMKNTFFDRKKVENYQLRGIALHNSKRESRRLIGDYIFSENDYAEGTNFPDSISYCGWSMDIHNVRGIYSTDGTGFLINKFVPITPIPYRILYSKNIKNMFMAGRCASATHLGMGSLRVEATIATTGQAVGVAASLCIKHKTLPRGIYENHIHELQQILLRQDQTIPYVKNEDKKDLALLCDISASSTKESERISKTYGFSGKWIKIDRPHTCRPMYRNNMIGADYYRVLLKNPLNEPCDFSASLLQKSENNENFELKESSTFTLPANFEDWFDLPFVPTSAGTQFAITINSAGILWRQRASVYDHMCYSYTDDNGNFIFDSTDALQLEYSDKTFDVSDCKPENIINGITRPYDGKLNGWMSDPDQEFPQSIILTLPEEKEISHVQITTDTDLTFPRWGSETTKYEAEIEHETEYTAKDITLSIQCGDEWKQIARVENNLYRQIKFNFEKQNATAVKVTVNSTTGGKSVRIYEVRIYE